MEFWGVEVNAGEELKVELDEDSVLHLSQAALGESENKGKVVVSIFVKSGNQKLALGSLFSAHTRQLSFDLVFEKEFELSHDWENGSVHFVGYKSLIDDGGDDDTSEYSEDSLDEKMPLKDDEETPTPKKAGRNKKRKAESATETQVPAKKVKAATPQKTGADKSKYPKSGGSIACKSCSCNKTFVTDNAMRAHYKVKHKAGEKEKSSC